VRADAIAVIDRGLSLRRTGSTSAPAA
jgi:hypothetical protein